MCTTGGENGKELICAWFPLIEVDGAKVFIKDDSAPRGIKQAETRYLALKEAKAFRDKLRSKEVPANVNED